MLLPLIYFGNGSCDPNVCTGGKFRGKMRWYFLRSPDIFSLFNSDDQSPWPRHLILFQWCWAVNLRPTWIDFWSVIAALTNIHSKKSWLPLRIYYGHNSLPSHQVGVSAVLGWKEDSEEGKNRRSFSSSFLSLRDVSVCCSWTWNWLFENEKRSFFFLWDHNCMEGSTDRHSSFLSSLAQLHNRRKREFS